MNQSFFTAIFKNHALRREALALFDGSAFSEMRKLPHPTVKEHPSVARGCSVCFNWMPPTGVLLMGVHGIPKGALVRRLRIGADDILPEGTFTPEDRGKTTGEFALPDWLPVLPGVHVELVLENTTDHALDLSALAISGLVPK